VAVAPAVPHSGGGYEVGMSTIQTGASPAPRQLAPGGRRQGRTLRPGAAGVLSLAAAGLLAACVPAGYGNYSPAAGRAATPAEALAVATAVHTSPLTSGAGTRPYRVETIRLSTGTPGYAFATIDPATSQLDGAAVALRLTPTTGAPPPGRCSTSAACTSAAPPRQRSTPSSHCTARRASASPPTRSRRIPAVTSVFASQAGGCCTESQALAIFYRSLVFHVGGELVVFCEGGAERGG